MMNSNVLDKNKINDNLAEVIEATDENIKKCAIQIQQGKIVGMPTETVYGLAANALDDEAVKKIFEYKGRPLSDPLIVHITSFEMALEYVDINEDTYNIFKLLTEKYWPGPLTIIVKANFTKISRILTAGTDFISLRYPNNEIAKLLINYSGLPIAAPSANKFCHISPVNPIHVYEDFKEFPVSILDGGVCEFSMESTVLKICSNNKTLEILRMGAISPENIEQFLSISKINYEVKIVKKLISMKDEHIMDTNESPGQFMKHYSPKLDTYILSDNEDDTNLIIEIKSNSSKNFVFLDYNKILFNKYNLFFPEENFLQLTSDGDAEVVMHNLYSFLHLAENFINAEKIILCDLDKNMEYHPHKQTLVDRMLKASAYKKINLLV